MSRESHKMMIATKDNGSHLGGGGAKHLQIEAARLRAIRESSMPPVACGPMIIAAPARGASVVVPHVAMVPNGQDASGLDKWEAAQTGYGHRASVRAADVFDRMVMRSRRADDRDPLTPGQIAQGRLYRALVERLDAGGIKLSSLDGGMGGCGERDFMDAHLDVSRQVAGMRRRIGDRISLEVRRIRPSSRGSRRSIPDRVIVDMMCLGDRTVSQVLGAHGWAVKGATRDAVIAALSASLDRMIGYRPEKSS